MSKLVIKVNTVDHSSDVLPESVSLERAMTSQVDTCVFNVVQNAGSSWTPDVLDEILVQEVDGVTTSDIFGGTIVTIEETMMGGDNRLLIVTCKDYSYDLDAYLVYGSFSNTTASDIIDTLVASFTDGTFTAEVSDSIEIAYIAFNYEYFTKCLQQMAEILNYDWYVDSDKVIHFFSKTEREAPFGLTDTGGKYYIDTLNLKNDIKNLKNAIVVRGGQYVGSSRSETQKADGVALIYTQGIQYSSVYVNVNSVSKTVGIDFIDHEADFDCFYNFQQKYIRFKTSTKPSVGVDVEVGGDPYIPVIVKYKSQQSIDAYGRHEFKIVDASINSKEGARDRAHAEVTAWGNTNFDAVFDTKEAGLDVGQVINVQSTLRGHDKDYVISRITTRLINGVEARHHVSCITTQNFGLIEFFQKLIMQKDKELIINADEVIDLVESAEEEITIADTIVASKVHNPITETVTVGESFTPQSLNYAVQFVAGPQAPSGTLRQFVVNGSPLA